MTIKVLCMGKTSEICNANTLILNNIKTTNELQNYLQEQYAGLKNIYYQVALNKKIVRTDTTLSDNDELALLPPFAGG